MVAYYDQLVIRGDWDVPKKQCAKFAHLSIDGVLDESLVRKESLSTASFLVV